MAVAKGAPARGALLSIRLPRTRGATLAFYVVRRIFWMVPVLLFVITITFVLMHLAPGSPWDRGGGRQLSPAVIADLNSRYGLDKPLWAQFGLYIWNVAHQHGAAAGRRHRQRGNRRRAPEPVGGRVADPGRRLFEPGSSAVPQPVCQRVL